MRMFKGAILALPDEGRITIFVPGWSRTSQEEVEYPDEWFVRVGYNNCPATGREYSHTHLSREGWHYNKSEIKPIFLASPHCRGTWRQFEEYVADFHDKLEKARLKKIAFFDGKIKELKEVVI